MAAEQELQLYNITTNLCSRFNKTLRAKTGNTGWVADYTDWSDWKL